MSNEENHEGMPEGEEAAPPGTNVMAIVRWVLVALMALIATASLLSYFGVVEKLAAAKQAGGPAKTLYYCPMHPSIVQDHPGECPICSMTLVPKVDGAAGKATPQPMEHKVPGLSAIDLAPERIQLLGMRTGRVMRQPLTSELRTVGYVAPNETGLAQIHTRFAGWIQQLNVARTGDHVNRGQVLATIYSPDVLRAEEEYLNARRWSAGGGGSDAERFSAGLKDDARKRLELLGISSQEIDTIEKTGQPMRALALRSPVDGYVIRKNAVEGLYVQPGAELFGIADLSTVWVLADVYEYEVNRVAVGQKALLTLDAYPGQTFTGRVQFLYPTVESESRTLRVRLEFRNAGLKLKPGMYGNVRLQLKAAAGLVVPAEAVVDTGERQYVFLAREGGHFEPRQVTLGARSDGKVEVLDGLAEGDTVVTTANFLIDSESRLRAAIEGEAESGGDEKVPIDKSKFPDKYDAWKQCERVHRGMGTMEEDCKNAIPKPWK